jgi:hypothetical protein
MGSEYPTSNFWSSGGDALWGGYHRRTRRMLLCWGMNAGAALQLATLPARLRDYAVLI